MSKQKYSKEFRDEAVRQAATSGKSAAQVARDLGLSVDTLYDWLRQARYSHSVPIPDQETPEQKIKRLERECADLREEAAILKKAIAYFSAPPKK
jgi:transposase